MAAKQTAGPGRAIKIVNDDTIPKPVYVANSYDGDPLGTSPWISPSKLIVLPRIYGDTKIFETLDAATGKKVSLERLNDEFKSREVSYNPWEISLSQDGKWLAFPAGTKKEPTWVAVTPDGTERREWPRKISDDGSNGKGAWMCDGDHFVEFSQRMVDGHFAYFATVCSLSAEGVQEYSVTPAPGMIMLPPLPNAQFRFTTDGHAYLIDPAARDTGAGVAAYADYLELVPGQDKWSLQKSSALIASTPELPVRGPSEIALSPDGNWIAWRNNSNSKTEPAQLIISHPDGTGARSVFQSSKSFWDFGWSADGTQITFKWDGDGGIANEPNGSGLYTLAVGGTIAKAKPMGTDSLLKRTAGVFPTTESTIAFKSAGRKTAQAN